MYEQMVILRKNFNKNFPPSRILEIFTHMKYIHTGMNIYIKIIEKIFYLFLYILNNKVYIINNFKFYKFIFDDFHLIRL
jgi:hypothetical protein